MSIHYYCVIKININGCDLVCVCKANSILQINLKNYLFAQFFAFTSKQALTCNCVINNRLVRQILKCIKTLFSSFKFTTDCPTVSCYWLLALFLCLISM